MNILTGCVKKDIFDKFIGLGACLKGYQLGAVFAPPLKGS
jgi:hypothetical protein